MNPVRHLSHIVIETHVRSERYTSCSELTSHTDLANLCTRAPALPYSEENQTHVHERKKFLWSIKVFLHFCSCTKPIEMYFLFWSAEFPTQCGGAVRNRTSCSEKTCLAGKFRFGLNPFMQRAAVARSFIFCAYITGGWQVLCHILEMLGDLNRHLIQNRYKSHTLTQTRSHTAPRHINIT